MANMAAISIQHLAEGVLAMKDEVTEAMEPTENRRKHLPEAVRYAANIENNFIAGGFQEVMNWTSKTLGKSKESILTHCTGAAYEGEKLCLEVPMPTPWSKDVDPAAPLPEYPRPQLRRDRWLNLNGIWHFQSRGVREMGGNWTNRVRHRIVVPFPVEAPLSGVANHDVNNVDMKYERNFTVPASWEGQRVLLHFDAVDHQAIVVVNGREVGTHQGGYDRFSFDITDDLHEGQNLLVVHAFDPTEFAHIPIGKQRLHPARHPSGIFYTSSSGIWQTVWLEPVPSSYIERIELVPDVDSSRLHVKVFGGGGAKDTPLTAVVTSEGKKVATAESSVGEAFEVEIPEPQLWSPDQPFLYDLAVTLHDGGSPGSLPVDASFKARKTIGASVAEKAGIPSRSAGGRKSGRLLQGLDSFLGLLFGGGGGGEGVRQTAKMPAQGNGDSVASYFAMRKASLGRTADGGLRPMLNNKFVFQTGMLDQGFWPDGLYTPATDDALVFDLEFTKELGYNMLRKHTKVESDRWYYHADRLGVLVWQDMPSMFYQSGEQELSVEDKRQYKAELQRIMQQHFNFPSIVAWVIFNEGWGQHDTVEVVKFAQSLDSTRVVDGISGWNDFPVGDMIDMHNYPGPGSPSPTATRAAVLGEYGGLGKRTEGHMWIPDDAFAYEMHLTSTTLQERYAGLAEDIAKLMVNPNYFLSAAVYTEVSDVEAEINGWITYDRQVRKVDAKVLFQANQELIAKSKSLGLASNATSVKFAMGNPVKVNPVTEKTATKASELHGTKPGIVS